MSDLRAIAGSYERIDGLLKDLRERHDAAGESDERDRVAREQEINDQAYFVLAWGQLETDIDEACRDAIRHGQAHDDWRERRAWTLYNPDDRRLSGLSFESRLTLVLARGSGEWRRTMQFYNVRNQIAHGTLLSERIDVSGEIQEFFRIRYRSCGSERPRPVRQPPFASGDFDRQRSAIRPIVSPSTSFSCACVECETRRKALASRERFTRAIHVR